MGRSLRVIASNDAARDLFGCSDDRLLGQSIYQLVPSLAQPDGGGHLVWQGGPGMLAKGRAVSCRTCAGEAFTAACDVERFSVGERGFIGVSLHREPPRREPAVAPAEPVPPLEEPEVASYVAKVKSYSPDKGVLGTLGEQTGACGVVVLRHVSNGAPRGGRLQLHDRWSAEPPCVPENSNAEGSDVWTQTAPRPEWMLQWETGYSIRVKRTELGGKESEIYARYGVETFLAYPLFQEDEWWGVVRIDFASRSQPIPKTVVEVVDLAVPLIQRWVLRELESTSAKGMAKEQFRTLFDSSPDLHLVVGDDKRVELVNASGANRIGYSVEDLVGEAFLRLVHEGDLDSVKSWLCAANSKPVDKEFRILRQDGYPLWVHAKVDSGRTASRNNGSLHLVCRDVTDRYLSEAHALRSNRRYEHIFRHTAVSLWDLDVSQLRERIHELEKSLKVPLSVYLAKNTHIVAELIESVKIAEVNEATLMLTEADSRDALVNQFVSLFQGDNFAAWREFIIALARGNNRFDTETVIITLKGRRFFVIFQASIPPEFDHGVNVCLALTNISERRRLERQLMHSAEHDYLTSLPNRSLFRDRLDVGLSKARRSNRRLALLYLDLDRFKPINDELGHEAGDQLLKETASRLRSCVRESDTVARYGGDEFIVLLDDIDEERDAEQVAEKILEALGRPVTLEGREVGIPASIGISFFPEDGKTQDQLIRRADAAMFAAKRANLRFCLYKDLEHEACRDGSVSELTVTEAEPVDEAVP
ncbi:MAG: diguanylate cyclase [Chromatiales bacterium]|nr:diguanylate cyclase [Chromatiales bacterium]